MSDESPGCRAWLMLLETALLLVGLVLVAAPLAPIGIAFADPGDLDPTFGTGGWVDFDLPGDVGLRFDELAVQPDGRILAVGRYTDGDNGYLLWFALRLNPEGTLDTTFGNGGVVSDTFPTTLQSYAHGVSIQPDGKIVVVGYVKNEERTEKRCSTARYLANGNLDGGFGTGGIVTNAVISTDDDCYQNVFLQTSGKMVLSGGDVATMRYDTLGSPDPTFGDGGTLGADIDDIQPDDKLVGGRRWGATRYTVDGDLDDTFGTGGMVTTTIPADISGGTALVQPDQKIMVKLYYQNLIPDPPYVLEGTIWARYESNGDADTDFGVGGAFTDTLIAGRGSPAILDGQGRYVVAVIGEFDDDYDWRLIRYSPNITLDTTFGTGGIVSPTHPPRYGVGPAIQSDNKILVGEPDEIARFDGATWDVTDTSYLPVILKDHSH